MLHLDREEAVFLRQGLAIHPRPAQNSPYTCLSNLGARITGVCHTIWFRGGIWILDR